MSGPIGPRLYGSRVLVLASRCRMRFLWRLEFPVSASKDCWWGRGGGPGARVRIILRPCANTPTVVPSLATEHIAARATVFKEAGTSMLRTAVCCRITYKHLADASFADANAGRVMTWHEPLTTGL